MTKHHHRSEHGLTTLLVNVLGLCLLALVILPRHADRMFSGLDGKGMLILARDQLAWMGQGTSISLNPLWGLTDPFFPANFTMMPPYFIPYLLAGQVSQVGTYCILAVQLFLATALWAKLAQLEFEVGRAAGWAIAVMSLPFLHQPLMNAFYQIAPYGADALFFVVAGLFCLRRVGRGSGAETAVHGVLIVMTFLYLATAHFFGAIMYGPMGGVIALVLIAASESRSERALKCAVIVVALVTAKAAGLDTFARGLTKFTPLGFFDGEFEDLQGAANAFGVSILFQSPTFPAGVYLVPLAIAGAAWAAIRGEVHLRRIAALHLLGMIGLIGGGLAFIRLFPNWRGPAIHYFEFTLWPAYFCFAAYAVLTPLAGLESMLEGSAAARIIHAVRTSPGAVIVAAVLAIELLVGSQPAPYRYPPAVTPIVEMLRRHASVSLDAPLRGYVATFAGTRRDGQPTSWRDLHAFDNISLMQHLGNDHRFIGLWHYSIPTLAEYDQCMSPFLYLVCTRLFARDIDLQWRTVVTFTKPDLALLPAFGVRFVISDNPLPGPAELRIQLPIQSGTALYLYELPAANVGQYSPTEVLVAPSATEALKRLKEHTDLTRCAILEAPVHQPLVPAASSAVTVVQRGVRVRARSPGVSMIVVPVQFSRCFQPVFRGKRPDVFSLHRANLVQLGVVFSGEMDVSLLYANGPGARAECRVEDEADGRRVGLAEAAAAFPVSVNARVSTAPSVR